MRKQRKWYDIGFISFLQAFFFIGLPFYYILPLALTLISVTTGHTVYVNTKPACLVIYDGNMVYPREAAGGVRGYVVYIQPEFYDDAMIHAHEYKHIEQYWNSFGLTKFYYAISTKYRMLCEYEAYLEELKFSNDVENDTMRAAVNLSTPHYDLGISVELAYLLLQNGINKHRGIE